MNKSALIIRNVSSIVPDEIQSIVALAGLDQTIAVNAQAAESVKQFQTKIANGEKITAELIQDEAVRDYLYEVVKARTGSHVILHLDHNKEDAEQYILRKLDNLKKNEHLNLLYLGGGHGGGHNGLVDEETNGLKKKSVLAIVEKIRDKELTAGAAIFGSCYSAAFTNHFRDFVIHKGVMLADSVECNNNSFTNVVSWINDSESNEFFSAEEIDSFKVKPSDLRAKFNEFVGMSPELDKKYLLIAYADYTQKELSTLDYEQVKLALSADNELNSAVLEHRTDLLDRELVAFSQDAAEAQGPLTADVLKPLIDKYPRINDYTAHLFDTVVFNSNIEKFINQLRQKIEEFASDNDPDDDADISEELFQYLQTQFQKPEEKNFLKIFEHMNKIEYAQNLEELREFTKNKLAASIAEYYDSTDDLGPQIKILEDEEVLYQKILQTMQTETLTSKVLSSPTHSALLKLSEATGKPAHACVDAYKRIEKVIEIIRSNLLVDVIIEEDVRKFNQISMMNDFNARFKNAMLESQKVVQARVAHEDQVALVIEHNHDFKDKFSALKANLSDEEAESESEGATISEI
ncbi:hypothetical protein [Legionella brunensis]|uniref:Uncharacterized protein n=1 Tax=Legionella brunensis TaxID=29422 RepID=A0A0W0SJ77_9GAMM|nr:hypothetical protein [Legionella brunensis]KTC82981.1 hypothetical protein Lbru_1719 [Legionella brunensis]